MKNHRIPSFLIVLMFAIPLLQQSCAPKEEKETNPSTVTTSEAENKAAFHQVLNTHFEAISDRDLSSLRSTLSPRGDMQLILEGEEIIDKVDGFMEYHAAWFQMSGWTMNNTVLNSRVGETMGMAVVEAMYREPERDGKPYFNRLNVSYDLEKIEGQWYVVKDHATSAEKSTDILKGEE